MKITLLLPICQTALACALLIWGRHVQPPMQLDTLYKPTVTSVCFGVNAPAVLLRPFIALLLPPLRLPFPPWANRLALDEIPFLFFVAVLWYLIGKRLASLNQPSSDAAQGHPGLKLATYIGAVAVAVFLSYFGIDSLLHPGRWNNPLGNRIEGSLDVAWAFALLIWSLKNVLRARPKAEGAKDNSR
jgi:hypothetical protein